MPPWGHNPHSTQARVHPGTRKTGKPGKAGKAEDEQPEWWLAHLCVFGKGGDSCRLRGDLDPCLAPLIDSHRARFLVRVNRSFDIRPGRPHLYKKRKGEPAPRPTDL